MIIFDMDSFRYSSCHDDDTMTNNGEDKRNRTLGEII